MRVDARKPLRILAADDSTVMREVLKMVFAMHASASEGPLPPMELVGVARDGIEALEQVEALRPDLLLLDLEMPRLSGLAVLGQLRTSAPQMPVIMCSAHTERGARVTLDALTLGAKDYVMKPGQQSDFAAALDTLMGQLLPRIAVLCAGSSIAAPPPARDKEVATPARPALTRAAPLLAPANLAEIIVVGVSTGGPAALEQMLPGLPANLPVPLLIVQHMPKLFTGALATRLNKLCRMPVQQARDGEQLRPGTVLIAPGDVHMEVARGAAGTHAVRLHAGEPRNSCRPSVDPLFSSAARLYGAGTLALMMTGMGQDGLDGAREVRDAGGTVLAQDEATSAVWGMPGKVVREGLAAATVPLGALAEMLLRRLEAGRPGWHRNPEPTTPAGKAVPQHLLATREPTHKPSILEERHGLYR